MVSSDCSISIAVVSSRFDLINTCIESLLAQSVPLKQYEILVVADYHEPPIDKTGVRWILNAPKSIAAKRNISLKESKGQIIAFTDDDCIADKDWLKRGLEYIDRHPEIAGVQGRVVIPQSDKDDPNYSQTRRLNRPLYQTSNIFYRVEAVSKVGGFDERFAFQREDADMGFTLIKAGFDIGYEPEAVVLHPVRKNEYWDLIKTAYRKRYDPLLKKKHPEMFKAHFYRIIPGSFLLMISLTAISMFFYFIFPFNLLTNTAPVFLGSAALTLRRHKNRPGGIIWLFASFFSYLLAPLLTVVVVFWGKIRWRNGSKTN